MLRIGLKDVFAMCERALRRTMVERIFFHFLPVFQFLQFPKLFGLLGLLSLLLEFLPFSCEGFCGRRSKSCGELHFIGAASKLLFPEITESCRVKGHV